MVNDGMDAQTIAAALAAALVAVPPLAVMFMVAIRATPRQLTDMASEDNHRL
ncbi:hypothetical protein [Arthrobacter sp. C152]